MLALEWTVVSDTGAVREANEDAALAERPLFAVADGMGGHAAGEIASALAVEELQALRGSDTVSRDDVALAIERGNQRIVQTALADARLDGMGTTITGAAITSQGGVEHWLVFNVGDSRVYQLSGGALSQITVDHSEVQELVQRGEITPEQARTHHQRNIVTRSLGTEPAPAVDWWLRPVNPGDRLLVCSDGLTEELDDREIERILTAWSESGAAAAELVRSAVAAGGRDNVTVIVVDVAQTHGSGLDDDTLPRIALETLEEDV